jgi:hypothetical protein
VTVGVAVADGEEGLLEDPQDTNRTEVKPIKSAIMAAPLKSVFIKLSLNYFF